MRYIHNGKLRNRTVDPPVRFVASEPTTYGRGRTNTAAQVGDLLAKMRQGPKPLVIGHE